MNRLHGKTSSHSLWNQGKHKVHLVHFVQNGDISGPQKILQNFTSKRGNPLGSFLLPHLLKLFYWYSSWWLSWRRGSTQSQCAGTSPMTSLTISGIITHHLSQSQTVVHHTHRFSHQMVLLWPSQVQLILGKYCSNGHGRYNYNTIQILYTN